MDVCDTISILERLQFVIHIDFDGLVLMAKLKIIAWNSLFKIRRY
ncbi:Uncharacterised protein [Legionella sainthelensi]|nr:Uncharacterised protein [Legionella sainthelensi]